MIQNQTRGLTDEQIETIPVTFYQPKKSENDNQNEKYLFS